MHDSDIAQPNAGNAAQDSRAVLDAIGDAWPAFTGLSLLRPEEVRYRRQAVAAFPCAMWIVVQTAYSTRSRVDWFAAQAVISAIDQAWPLIPALAGFLRTTSAVIRKTRSWPFAVVQGLGSRRSAGRFVHCLGVTCLLPDEVRDDLPLLQTWLPVVDVLARRGGLGRQDLLNLAQGLLDDVHHCPPSTPLAVLALHRELLRTACARDCTSVNRIRGIGSVLRQACFGASLRLKERERPERPEARAPIHKELSCGWSAIELREWKHLRREGREMRHCIANYVQEVEDGDTQVFSLRCIDTTERITVLFSPPLGDDEGDLGTQVEVRGPRNSAVSLRALAVLLELTQTLGSPGIRIEFGSA